jgi:hypothetical protein
MDLNQAWNGHAIPASNTSQTELPATLASTKPKRSRIHQRNQAATLQRLTYDAALSLRTACTKDGVFNVTRDEATALAQLVRAWDTARDAVRILRGRGLPASVKSRAVKSSTQPQPLEPLR